MDASSLIAAFPLPAVLVGPGERVEAMNDGATALLGLGMIGRHYITVLRQPGVQDATERVLKGAPEARGRYQTTEAGRDVTYAVIARHAGSGNALITFEDMTATENAAQVRRDFVANVSHELRTPLTAMTGFIETLRGPARDDAAARERFLGTMAREAARMNRLVHDLLSLSRVEADARLRPGKTADLAAVLAATVAAIRPVAENSDVALVATGIDAPIPIVGDADQLQQVFVNLAENAVKYGADNVRITVGTVEHDPLIRAPGIRVEVVDDGMGIDPIHLPRITERFYRVDTHRSREMGGTGLGLAICKHIVNRHRGRLRIDSAPGQGTRVVVVLPEGMS